VGSGFGSNRFWRRASARIAEKNFGRLEDLQVIIKDESLLTQFRRKTHCEWCLRPRRRGELQVNHVFCRGQGGGKRLDIRVNLVSLCWQCHGSYHDGWIKRRELLDLVAAREGTTIEAIITEIYRLRRAPKGVKA
jgi:hypothetical protein